MKGQLIKNIRTPSTNLLNSVSKSISFIYSHFTPSSSILPSLLIHPSICYYIVDCIKQIFLFILFHSLLLYHYFMSLNSHSDNILSTYSYYANLLMYSITRKTTMRKQNGNGGIVQKRMGWSYGNNNKRE